MAILAWTLPRDQRQPHFNDKWPLCLLFFNIRGRRHCFAVADLQLWWVSVLLCRAVSTAADKEVRKDIISTGSDPIIVEYGTASVDFLWSRLS